MKPVDVALKTLRKLGRTSDEVAESLMKLGIKAKRPWNIEQSPCPLELAIGADKFIVGATCFWERSALKYGNKYEEIKLPTGCYAFRADFDSGGFPWLEL